ncbi:MAG: ABC transporter permease [Pyrinomonadaceae bacterium]|nr:ABC transporter permease [Pyrinomonadaceae bacterium]
MKRYVLIRFLSLVPLWLGISMLAFLLSNLAPGDPATVIAHRLSDATPSEEQIATLRREYHLDDTLPLRYARWLGSAAQGDLGISYRTKEPVLMELATHFPATLQIACAALVIALAIALPLGVLAAVRRGSWLDHAARVGALLGASLPSYWLGYLLILLFALALGWLPVAGRDGTGAMILPSLTLGLGTAATLARLTRSSLLEVLGEDFVRTARAKGLSEWAVLWHHSLKAALLPVVTVTGIAFGHLLGGAVIVEEIFAWPGVGNLLINSIYDRDYPMIQGFVLFMGAVFTLLSTAVDLSYAWIDPRVRYANKRRIGR